MPPKATKKKKNWALGAISEKYSEVMIVKKVRAQRATDVYAEADQTYDDPWGLPEAQCWAGHWDDSQQYVAVDLGSGTVYTLEGDDTGRNIYRDGGAPPDELEDTCQTETP